MLNLLLIFLGKIFSSAVQLFNLGAGSTWPGHIALGLNKHFIREVLSKSDIKIILIAGTNGKTTTSKLIRTGLEKNGMTVIQNQSGANLLNGIASTLIQEVSFMGNIKKNFAIFEIDENTLPLVLEEIKPDYLVLLNLFRDQLDRYGEVNTIITNWKDSIKKLSKKTKLVLNADDPQIAYLGDKQNSNYFGFQNSQFSNSKLQHAADSVYCPKCGNKLDFAALAFSHLGNWHCNKCGLKRPQIKEEKFSVYPLSGLYNKYNVLAAGLVLKIIGLTTGQIEEAFANFEPAFGRQEIIKYKNRTIQVFLSKNPTSFNQSYQAIHELNAPARIATQSVAGGKALLIVLNDRIPDGRDVSWIWDVDLPNLDKFKQIFIAGDRVYDMALRLKYEREDQKSKFKTYENLEEAINDGVKSLDEKETLFILPTYSAMLEVRKIITGKKIL